MSNPLESYTLADLLHIIQQLRDPETGCPWDIRQSHQSLCKYLIEETYEVIDAINLKDTSNLKEELGDVLFQIVFHSQIAHEQHNFDFADVIHEVCAKMIRRHPHVFGSLADKKLTEDEIQQNWFHIKASENKGKISDNPVSDVKSGCPALNYATNLGKAAATVGFNWPDKVSVLDKITEEVAEIHAADADRLQEEIGDLLFATMQLCRKSNLDPEETLRKASHKFRYRFEAMVAHDPDQLPADLNEWELRWQQVKAIKD